MPTAGDREQIGNLDSKKPLWQHYDEKSLLQSAHYCFILYQTANIWSLIISAALQHGCHATCGSVSVIIHTHCANTHGTALTCREI